MAKGQYERWQTKDNLILLEGWARDGLTDEQIAHNIGIRRETLYDWKKKYPNISNALKNNKELADQHVEQALFRKATGYKTKEIIRERQWNKATGQEISDYEVENALLKKALEGNVVAQIYWLKNRRPDKWREQPKEKVDFEDIPKFIDDIE